MRTDSRPILGFTLIELLVVISIVTLLITMLLPSLSAARALAQSTKCLANERQISIATRSYVTENRDWWMISGYQMCGHPEHTCATWAAVVAVYGNNPYITEYPTNATIYPDFVKFTGYSELKKPRQGILKCPSSISTNAWGGTTSVSYGYNSGVGGLGVNEFFGPDAVLNYGPVNGPIYRKYYGRVRTTDIYRAAETIHVADMVTQGNYEYAVYQMGGPSTILDLHPNNTANLLFTDGHAENRRVANIIASDFVRY
jgi:prepilin-type N-terminal cleavage/methylation domain-containing protein/prepilin-type processing-associated H-X9-DG protein